MYKKDLKNITFGHITFQKWSKQVNRLNRPCLINKEIKIYVGR